LVNCQGMLSKKQLDGFQERQASLETAIRLNQVYQRGREEAISSLLRRAVLSMRTTPQAPPPPAGVEAEATNEATNDASDAASVAGIEQAKSLGPVKDQNTLALEALGSGCLQLRKKNIPYFDASRLKDPDPEVLANRRLARGGVMEPFPEKLHRMLSEVEARGEEDIVSFQPHGRAFIIRDVDRFCRTVMPRYFQQRKLASFHRQLNLYGFARIKSGPDSGGFYHELFLKGRPALTIHMQRVGATPKTTSPRPRGGNRRSGPPSPTPDFYAMDAISNGTAVDERRSKSEKLLHTQAASLFHLQKRS